MKQKILLYIDDDTDDLEFFSSAIKVADGNINCICYNKSEEALKALINEEIRPDWIVSDLNMPKICGVVFLSKIKEHAQLKNIPVFILSTCDDEDTRTMMKKKGADDYFVKPSSSHQMQEIISKILAFVVVG